MAKWDRENSVSKNPCSWVLIILCKVYSNILNESRKALPNLVIALRICRTTILELMGWYQSCFNYGRIYNRWLSAFIDFALYASYREMWITWSTNHTLYAIISPPVYRAILIMLYSSGNNFRHTKRRQTETSTNLNVNIPKRLQTIHRSTKFFKKNQDHHCILIIWKWIKLEQGYDCNMNIFYFDIVKNLL